MTNEEKEIMKIVKNITINYLGTDCLNKTAKRYFKDIAQSIHKIYKSQLKELKAENDKLRCIIKSLDLKQMGFIAWDKTLTDEELKLFNSLINQKG